REAPLRGNLEAVELRLEVGRVGLEVLVRAEILRQFVEQRDAVGRHRIDGWHLRVSADERYGDFRNRQQVARLAMDVLRADADLPRRFRLHAGRELVGVRLLQVWVDGGNRSPEAEELRTLLAGLELVVVVAIDPGEAVAAQVVLVRWVDVSGAHRVVVPRVAGLDRHGVRRQGIEDDADPR